MDRDEKPWTEAQWEAAMKRSDGRSARYAELLETMIDDPDLEVKLSHEMGWDEPLEASESFFSDDATNVLDDEEITAELEEEDKQLHAIPAYMTARELGARSAQALKPLMSNQEKDEELSEECSNALIGSNIAAAKIAGGHGMGYDDEMLCGNIVNIRRGLDGAKQGLEGWLALQKTGIVPTSIAHSIIADHAELIRMMDERIAELRRRVWW